MSLSKPNLSRKSTKIEVTFIYYKVLQSEEESGPAFKKWKIRKSSSIQEIFPKNQKKGKEIFLV